MMRIETGLAKASLTRVERRDPYKIKHKMKVAELNAAGAELRLERVFLYQPGAAVRDSECRMRPTSSRR